MFSTFRTLRRLSGASFLAAGCLLAAGCGSDEEAAGAPGPAAMTEAEAEVAEVPATQPAAGADAEATAEAAGPEIIETEEGLVVEITERGTGPMPETGDTVAVHYRGTLEDGTEFDSSYSRGEPIRFPIGRGRVIEGWDQGIMMLPEGSKATLRIPAALGYGARGAGGAIPPNADLVFDVELVSVE